ncbi:hypothetical protein VTO42DRAFT_735 [Malbranchea cinnamomea]
MSKNIDFDALKARAMGSGIDEEAVTVNTRALIDKVLARYSGEWTVLRELLQNAADASATAAVIKLETIPSTTVPVPLGADSTTIIKHTISHHTLQRLVFRNNGLPFNASDWARLKRIAEGNPDETKIGAFGVGFYSVFADCEEPFVSSGKEAMAFYWKGNALYTRRLQLDESDSSPDTSFILDYRNNTTPVPALRPLCEFLASSLTFVGLQSIELWLDNWKLLTLSKSLSPAHSIPIPKDVKVKTDEGLMKVSAVTIEVSRLEATWMRAVEWKNPSSSSRFEVTRNTDSLRSFFSRLTGSSTKKNQETSEPPADDLTTAMKSTVELHCATTHIVTSVSQSFSRELERATKKFPPKTTKLSILTSRFDAKRGSVADKDFDVLSAVLPAKSGRIYIGFATHQTTGLNAHISAPSLIPTVERESIDLNARWVRTWNLELLRVAGIACRIAWSAEMGTLKKRLNEKMTQTGRSKLCMDDINEILPYAIHVSNQFFFRESTPAVQVGQVIENSFWTCSQNAYLEVLSTRGVLPSYQVRASPKDLSFMDGIPAIPEKLFEGAKEFVTRLLELGLVTDLTISDIKQELETNTISSQQLVEFISWVAGKAVSGKLDEPTVKTLLVAAVAEGEVTEGRNTGIIVLKNIDSYLNPARIPVELPVPPSVLPFEYTRSLSQDHLNALGWQELRVDAWVQWLVENHANLPGEQDITRSPEFSARVLSVASKQWDSIGSSDKEVVLDSLRSHTVIPTKLGMKRPGEAYFPYVRLFDDLPVVIGLTGVKEKFLATLGVRKTVELSIIFDRLLSTGPDQKGGSKHWSHVDLIKYLASVRNDIPSEDIARLKQTRICTNEASGDPKAATTRYRVCELYEPKESLRDLGLPLLYWPSKYQPGSPEGRFLTLLGLKSFPSATELIELMAHGHSNLAEKARRYFISEYVHNGYNNFDYSSVTIAFVPVERGKLCTPSLCFTDNGASLFGFDILRQDLHPHASKFGVRTHPPINDCVNFMLLKPPDTRADAKVFFEYFSRRLPEINSMLARRIGQSPIVPISPKSSSEKNNRLSMKASGIRHITPLECYLGSSDDYEDIFDFVDFGEQANLFLLACGSKREPTNVELASMLAREPARVSATLQTEERYLKLLRSIANSMPVIRKNRELFKEMKRAPFLLATRQLTPNSSSGASDRVDGNSYEEEKAIREYQLVKAADAVIVDDYATYNLFKENILAAPQEELLEAMYMSLGTPCLSQLIEEQAQCGNPTPDQSAATSLQKRIYERSRLFLHDMPPDLIKHDAKWLETRLTVQVVTSITLHRSLRGRNLTHKEKRGAAAIAKANNWILYISGSKIDFYQVSQALAQLMLFKAKLHSTLTLEMLLKTDLLELRARGYNVERILRQKAAEARMAETKRQQQLEAEMRQIQERELERRRNQEQTQNAMPGVFPESPTQAASTDTSKTQASDGRGHSFFSNLSRRLGLRDLLQPSDTHSPLLRDSGVGEVNSSDVPPPPYSPDDPRASRPTDTSTVTPPEALRTNLLSAVRSCRPHGSTTVYSRGERTQVAETRTYCDERPSQDLVFAANLRNGIKLFFARSLQDRSKYLETQASGLDAFSAILADCASIFLVGMESINIFYDPGSKTIAFNRQGSLFCNYTYFRQLHLEHMLKGQRTDALVYWFVVLCHELAHNLVEEHNSHHSYYTESFVTEYFSKVIRKIREYEASSSTS